ncbi:hypothetical protein ACWKWC_02730 [Geodermatophilus nigrescens]
MLYLVQPDGRLLWEELFGQRELDLVRENPEADLMRLDWKPAERVFTDDTVRVAVRYGVACSGGIAVDAGPLVQLDRVALITRTSRDARQAREQLAPFDALTERLIPGWTEHGRQVNERVDAATERAISGARKEEAEMLAAPVQDDLVRHWRSLGGHLPDPL